jgi:hypothetical protein
MNVYFKIFLILFLNYTLIFGKDNQEDDKELISSSLKSYFSEVDEKDFESMLDYIKLPFILNFESKEPLNLKSEEEFIEVFELWSKSEKANYYETILDSVSYTEIHKNFMWVVDVTYSRVGKKSKSKETNRSLYYFMKKEDFWKIYMVSSIAFD